MTIIQEQAVFPFTEQVDARLREITRGVADAFRMYEPALARTLKSQGGGMGALTGLYDDGKAEARGILVNRIRRLTPLEAERLQGFPDNWTVGNDTQRARQCGNAVTVNVVRDVALRLLAPA
jgi:site-specific DNA-cytosine methylase